MRADCGLYPRLGRYFKTAQELADAATMSRPTLLATLHGKRSFTRQEKLAVCNALAFKVSKGEITDLAYNQLEECSTYKHTFDELFKTKE